MYFNVEFEHAKNDWRKFENDAADVFENFDYDVDRDVRFKTDRRFQIDFIAYGGKRAFFVDCKNHGYIPPEKEREFMEKQKKRAESFLRNGKNGGKTNVVLLVTKNRTNSLLWHAEGKGKIYSVDLQSLPHLLKDIERYEEELVVF